MFEYLMPLLVMPTYDNTLLDQTARAAVARQIAVRPSSAACPGACRSPATTRSTCSSTTSTAPSACPAWGSSAAGRGPGRRPLCLGARADGGARGGLPESPAARRRRGGRAVRLLRGDRLHAIPPAAANQASAVVRSFMAHHQGMSLLSLAYLLLDRPMQKRFASEPLFQATAAAAAGAHPQGLRHSMRPPTGEITAARAPAAGGADAACVDSPDTPIPEVQLLSNGRYHVMVTNAGGGYSRWQDLAVTRWREDGTRDAWGTFCYLRDLESGAVWSTAYQPTLASRRASRRSSRKAAPSFVAAITISSTHTEIVVSPEDDIELRRVRITNRSRAARHRGHQLRRGGAGPARRRHPASGLQQPLRADRDPRGAPAILCTRRPRSRDEPIALDVSPDGSGARRARSASLPILRDRP
jgi:cyclic beta-1,2-glucan synthetase